MSEQQNWSQQRRARHQPQNDADAAVALCTRHLRSGALTRAASAALLAHRLVRLEAALAERQKKRDFRASIERHRAETALAEARKAVAALTPPPEPKCNILCADDEWPETLKRIIADANAQRPDAIAEIGSAPVRNPASDSC